MAVGGGDAVDRAVHVQVLADAAGAKVDEVAQGLFELGFVHVVRVAVEFDIEGEGVGDADGVAELEGAAVGQAGGDDVLGEVAADIGGGAVDLGGVLAAEGAAAVGRRAAIGVDDDLAPGEAAIAVGPADDEVAGGVDVDLVFGGHPAFRQGAFDQRQQARLDRGLVHAFLVLGGDHHRGGGDRLAVDVAQGDLALGVGQEAGDRGVAAHAQVADGAQEFVRIVERRRHQVRCLAAGVAEHDALVAGAFVLVARGVHALGDVGGLGVQVDGDFGVLPGEAGLVVADVLDGHAGEMGEQFGGDAVGAAGFAGENDAVGGDEGFAGDPGIGIGGEVGVQHRIADPVGYLVGMAFRDGLGGKQELALVAHRIFPEMISRGWACGARPRGNPGRLCVAERVGRVKPSWLPIQCDRVRGLRLRGVGRG